jgi:hypothetical protein
VGTCRRGWRKLQTPEPFIKIVDYDLVIITAADWQFKAIDKQAQFTIRLDEDTGKYQIRLWHDLADG